MFPQEHRLVFLLFILLRYLLYGPCPERKCMRPFFGFSWAICNRSLMFGKNLYVLQPCCDCSHLYCLISMIDSFISSWFMASKYLFYLSQVSFLQPIFVGPCSHFQVQCGYPHNNSEGISSRGPEGPHDP